MRVLVVLQAVESVSPEQFERYAGAEALAVGELVEAGWARQAYCLMGARGGVLLLECRSLAEAQQVVATLPLVKAGLVSPALLPLRAWPALGERLAGRRRLPEWWPE